MSISPIITFKAGICDFDNTSSPARVNPKPTPGYIYLFEEDELIQFCWRPRSAPMSSPDLKLSMVPTDGRFVPYQGKDASNTSSTQSPTNGRIFVLKFQSSSARHLFWLQSKSQHSQNDPSWFSPRDLRLGAIVDRLLQGEEVDVQEVVANVSNEQEGGGGGDTEMEDARPEDSNDTQRNLGSGDPFMGNPEEEGSESRDGGADGGRAPPTEATIAVQNFLQSLQGSQDLKQRSSQSHPEGQLYTTLSELLPPSTTIPVLDDADVNTVDNLLSQLPPILLVSSQETNDDYEVEPTAEQAQAAIDALSIEQKKEILRKVFRSPQFSQSLGSLTTALRDGGLPSVSDALKIPVTNGGFVKQGSGVPMGGGDAVEAFVEGVKTEVQRKKSNEGDEGRMDTE